MSQEKYNMIGGPAMFMLTGACIMNSVLALHRKTHPVPSFVFAFIFQGCMSIPFSTWFKSKSKTQSHIISQMTLASLGTVTIAGSTMMIFNSTAWESHFHAMTYMAAISIFDTAYMYAINLMSNWVTDAQEEAKEKKT